MTEAVRNQPLCGSPLFGGYSTRYQTYTPRAALAAWLRTHAGQARMLWEFATGEELTDPTTGEVVPPCSPRNPMGELGECHAGGFYGKPFTHTFYAWVCQPMDDAPSSSGNPLYTSPPYMNKGAGASLNVGFDNSILVPVPAGPAYWSCSVDSAIYVSVAAASSEVYLDVISEGSGIDGARTVTLSTASTGYVAGTQITNFDLTPGKLNKIRVRLYSDSVSAITCYLQALVFSQTT